MVNFLHNRWLTGYLIISGATDLAHLWGRYPVSAPSPALADAGRLLHDDRYVHLHEAEYLAEQGGEWSPDDGETARKLIGDLALIMRKLLGEHRLHTAVTAGPVRRCGPARW